MVAIYEGLEADDGAEALKRVRAFQSLSLYFANNSVSLSRMAP